MRTTRYRFLCVLVSLLIYYLLDHRDIDVVQFPLTLVVMHVLLVF
jgi:hypothetical protein